MTRLAIAVLAFLVCCGFPGCSTRESAKALVQADQSLEAIQTRLAEPETREQVATLDLTPEQRQWVEGIFVQIYQLAGSGRESLAPGLRILSGGEPVEVPTTVDLALTDTPTFLREASKQAARAEVEAENYLAVRSIGGRILSWGKAALGSGLGLTLGGSGGILALVAAGLKVWQMHQKGTKALDAMASYSAEADQATSPEELKRIREKHQAAQKAAGIHALIDPRVQARKPSKPKET